MKYKVLIAQCLMSLALVGCQALAPEPTATPTATATPLPTSTPTITPSPTATLIPTATATPALASRGLIIFTSFDPYPALMAVTGDGLDSTELFRFVFPYIGIGAYWAPDASKVAVHLANVDAGPDRIGIFDTATAEFTIIERDIPGLVGPLSWSADSRYVVYGAPQADGAERDVYRLEVSTGAVTNLTRNFPHWDSAPVYSPDGRYIYYTSDSAVEGGKALDEIWRMNADGTGHTNLTNNGFDWEDNWAAVNSEGVVAYLRSGLFNTPGAPGGPAGLWLMDADGSNQRFLASVPIIYGREAAAWSPDGNWLALIPIGDDTSMVFLIDADTGKQTTFNVDGNAFGITWSPDSLAFHFTSQTDDDTIFYIYAVETGTLYQPLDWPAGFGGWSPPVSAP